MGTLEVEATVDKGLGFLLKKLRVAASAPPLVDVFDVEGLTCDVGTPFGGTPLEEDAVDAEADKSTDALEPLLFDEKNPPDAGGTANP